MPLQLHAAGLADVLRHLCPLPLCCRQPVHRRHQRPQRTDEERVLLRHLQHVNGPLEPLDQCVAALRILLVQPGHLHVHVHVVAARLGLLAGAQAQGLGLRWGVLPAVAEGKLLQVAGGQVVGEVAAMGHQADKLLERPLMGCLKIAAVRRKHAPQLHHSLPVVLEVVVHQRVHGNLWEGAQHMLSICQVYGGLPTWTGPGVSSQRAYAKHINKPSICLQRRNPPKGVPACMC